MPNRRSVPIVSGFKEHLQEISRNPGLPYGPFRFVPDTILGCFRHVPVAMERISRPPAAVPGMT